MREKIKKLLASGNLEDHIIAITLAYNLPMEEFYEMFETWYTNLPSIPTHIFRRSGRTYAFGSGSGFMLTYDPGPTYWIDITPEDYEGENS